MIASSLLKKQIILMKKKLSIKDIANVLKVSTTAVSFIINGKARERKISKNLEMAVLD